ncbi:unnamed protein product, partial [Medioppia subpectinata]
RVYHFGRTCGDPDIPVLAQVRRSEIVPKEIVEQWEYVCIDNDHTLDGNTHIRCGPNGKWLNEFPTCLPLATCKAMSFDLLDKSIEVKYESVIYGAGGEVNVPNGKMAQFTCTNANPLKPGSGKQGYHLNGVSRVLCRNGEWLGLTATDRPHCTPDSSMTSVSKRVIRVLSAVLLVCVLCIVCLVYHMFRARKARHERKLREIKARLENDYCYEGYDNEYIETTLDADSAYEKPESDYYYTSITSNDLHNNLRLQPNPIYCEDNMSMKSDYNECQKANSIYSLNNTRNNHDQNGCDELDQECSCGTIARPPGIELTVRQSPQNMSISQANQLARYNDSTLKHNEHLTRVWYQCSDPNNLLVGNRVRECRSGKWMGSVPRCAINYGNQTELTLMEILEHDIKTTIMVAKVAKRYKSVGAFTPPMAPIGRRPVDCLNWRTGAQQQWILALNHAVDVQYIRLTLYGQNLRDMWLRRLITFNVFLNNIRGIDCALNMDTMDSMAYHSTYQSHNYLTLEYQCETDFSRNHTNKVHAIVINFAHISNTINRILLISLCDLR